MMYRALCLATATLFLVLFSCRVEAQSTIWYFGNKAGIRFEKPSYAPVAISGSQSVSYDGSAVATDKNDSLLFYSNGEKVWNRKHQLMANGLVGSGECSQNSTLVPMPGSDSLYYLFTNDFYNNTNGFRYSIIDRTLNNGLGGLVPGTKNTLIRQGVTEGVGICKNKLQTGYWIVVRSRTDASYYAYELTSTGLNAVPVQSTGILSGLSGQSAISYMKIAFNGSRLVHTGIGGTELANFNNATGQATGFSVISNGVFYYGVEFSPNDQYLYFTADFYSSILRYEIATGTATTLQTFQGTRYIALELAPDGKIYIGGPDLGSFISAIANPNAGGTIEDTAFIFAPGTNGRVGLPNTAHVLPLHDCGGFTPVTLTIRADTLCLGSSFPLPLNPQTGVGYAWSPSLGLNNPTMANPIFTPSDTGQFLLHLTLTDLGECEVKDSFLVTVRPVPLPLPVTRFTPCMGKSVSIGTPAQPGMTYSWTPTLGLDDSLSSNPLFTVTETGTFQFVRNAGNGTCSVQDSVHIEVVPLIDVLETDYRQCQGTLFQLAANGFPSTQYLWTPTSGVDDATVASPIFTETNAGNCTLFVTSSNLVGCTQTDTVRVNIVASPVVEVGPYVAICSGVPFTLTATENGTYQYEWRDTKTNAVVADKNKVELTLNNATDADETYTFRLRVLESTGLCSYEDSIGVKVFPRSALDANEKPKCVLIYVPNLVTPDGNAQNDYFEVKGLDAFTRNELHLYDRWGKLVYHAQPYASNWQGNDLAAGIYFYRLVLGVGNNRYEGWLNLLK